MRRKSGRKRGIGQFWLQVRALGGKGQKKWDGRGEGGAGCGKMGATRAMERCRAIAVRAIRGPLPAAVRGAAVFWHLQGEGNFLVPVRTILPGSSFGRCSHVAKRAA